MARSVVSVEQIRQFKASFVSYGSNSEAVLGSFREKVASMLSDFEDKLDELEDDMDRKEQALDRCEWSHRNDDGDHCSSQRSAYYRAQARYSSCLSLVQEARNAIGEFDSKVESFQAAKEELVSMASVGLDRVEELIADYSSGSATQGSSGPGGQISIPSINGVSGEIDTEASGMHSAIHISGGDKIAYVLPKGSGTDPVVIDPEAMAHKFNSLPPIQDPDPQTMRIAADGIITLLAAGGLAVGSKEMLLQQKTDEIFQQQYGISRTELLIGSGPKQKEYVDAYNRINQGLQKEMVEKRIEVLEDQIKDAESKDGIKSIEEAVKLRVDLENARNQRATIEDGIKRSRKPYEKAYVAGLSEESLLYLMDHGSMTPGRYGTTLLALAQSDFSFEQQNGLIYAFRDDTTRIEIYHNGSYITIEKADAGVGCSADASLEAQTSLSQSSSKSWQSQKPTELESNKNVVAGIGASATLGGSCSAAVNYGKETFYIDEKGRAFSLGYNVRLGPEGYVEGGFKAELSAEVYSSKQQEIGLRNAESGIGAGGAAGVSASKGEVKTSISSPPVKIGRSIYQGGIEGTLGGDLGVSGEGSYQFSSKGFEAKGEISALLKASAKGHVHRLSLDNLPESVSKRLESVSTPLDAVLDTAGDMADAYAKSMRPGERPMI